MSTRITLSVVTDNREVEQFAFEGRSRCVVGRERCEICLPRGRGHMDVSRRHCEFEIEPPVVRVRDLGSMNGTFVNGAKIGQRTGRLPPTELDPIEFPTCELMDGDEVQVGQHIIRVSVCVTADGWPAVAVPLSIM